MTQEKISRKITVLSFLAMIGVVMIHSNTLGTMSNAAGWNIVIQKILTRTFTAWAVLFFFVLSGFWFTRGRYIQENGGGYRKLILKKMKTLLVPYLIWAVVGSAIVIPLFMFNNHVNHMSLFDRTFLGVPGVWSKIDKLFGVTTNGPIGNLALWYVRTLLILFVAAPIWKLLYRTFGKALVVFAIALSLLTPEVWVPYVSIKLGSIGWFLFGVGISRWIAEERKIPLPVVWTAGLGWAALSVASAAGYAVVPSLIPLCGIVFMWGAYDLVMKRDFEVPRYMKKSFWVYCLHGSMIGYLLAGIPYVVGKTDISTLVTTLVSPVIAIVVCLFAAYLCKKINVKLFDLLCGGRG